MWILNHFFDECSSVIIKVDYYLESEAQHQHMAKKTICQNRMPWVPCLVTMKTLFIGPSAWDGTFWTWTT